MSYLCTQNHFPLFSESATVISVAVCAPESPAPRVDLIISPILGELEELTNKLSLLPLLNRKAKCSAGEMTREVSASHTDEQVYGNAVVSKTAFSVCSFAHFPARRQRGAASHSLHAKPEEQHKGQRSGELFAERQRGSTPDDNFPPWPTGSTLFVHSHKDMMWWPAACLLAPLYSTTTLNSRPSWKFFSYPPTPKKIGLSNKTSISNWNKMGFFAFSWVSGVFPNPTWTPSWFACLCGSDKRIKWHTDVKQLKMKSPGSNVEKADVMMSSFLINVCHFQRMCDAHTLHESVKVKYKPWGLCCVLALKHKRWSIGLLM